MVFLEKPTLRAELIAEGGLRPTGPLSGLPKDEALYSRNECAFCLGAAKVHKVFQDQNLAVVSLSRQILVIPKKHYAHWFAVPLEEQIELFKDALEVRKENPSSIFTRVAELFEERRADRRPIELHCGAAAGQTVFHLHVRTGVYH